MPYTNAQRKQHIMELQRYLYAISLFNTKIPHIIVDGRYGSETSVAVRAFQREYGLSDTGSTDPVTWNKIVSVYRAYLRSAPAAYNIFPSSSYVVRNGDSGSLVCIIQAMLNDIGTNYDNMVRPETCGTYNAETVNAVKQFQRKVGLPQSGEVDSSTWNMLVHCCEHINSTLQ